MSAVSVDTSQALPVPVPAATRHRSIRVTQGHVVAVLLATLVTSVLDLAYLFDKLGKPGIWKIIAFEPILSLLIFTSALLAWLVVAAEQGAHPLGHACRSIGGQRSIDRRHHDADCKCRRHRSGMAGIDGEEKADAAGVAAVHR